jgi:diguanylate cyclase (GGDEF)-like protein/PAS domain S-box-containing protein
LQSLNEEVQSSSEELQSSNEELQSSNEELTTLNDELRLKSIEAAQLNTTLGNIQNSVRTALVVIDLDGRITRYNTLAVRIFGLVPNDVGQHLYGVPCQLDLPQLREQVGSVVHSGDSLVERVNQREFHYLMQIDPYRNELGVCTGAVLTFTDVSELHRSETARQSIEARFRHVWEASTEGMLVVDASTTIVLANPALERMFGYPAGGLIGQPVNVLVPPEIHAPHRGQMQAFIEGTEQTRLMGRRWQIHGRRRDGSELSLQISLTTMLLDNARHVLATLADVTERQRAESALIGSEQRLRLALDASRSGTWEWFLDSNENIWSEQLWALYGLVRGQHPPSYESWLGAMHPDDRARVAEAISGAASQGVDFEIEWRVNLPATLRPRWLMARGRPIRGSDGRPRKYLGIVMDITSRHEAEQRRQRSEALEHELKVLQQVLESSLAGYFDWNITAGTEYFSPTFKAMFGYDDHELANSPETWRELICPEDLPGVLAVYQRHVDSLGALPYYNEVRLRHKNGSMVWVICAGRVIEWGPAGEPLRLVGCLIDITRLRELEAERARNHDMRLSTILENLGTGVYIKDCDYRYIYANRVVCDALQLRLDELIGYTDADILDAESLAVVRAHDSRILENGEHLEFEEVIPTPAGDERTYLSVKLPLRRSDGSIDGLCGIATDITERKASEARLKLAASVFTHAQEGILITDPDNRIIEVNDTFCQLTGFARTQVLGQEVQTLIAEPQRTELLPLVCEELTYKGQWHGEVTIQRANGSVLPVMLHSSVVQGDAAQPQCYVSLFSDISALKEHQRQLERVAHYDSLTGLANRVLLADRLQHAMVQAQRRNRHLALVYLDLDGFKAVNDSHGHDVGDTLLVQISGQLRAALRQGDTLARLGGDEFVAVLSDLASPAEYELVVTRLLQAAATPVRIEQQSFQLSASLGVTLFPLDNGDADTLLRHADQAMYQAKLAGKNRYHLFDPEHDRQTRNRWDSMQHIAQALAAREFVLHYQPKVNMRSGALVGVEALVRWQHPERGLLAPGEFLPLIEDQPLIAELGCWVLDAALDQALAWQQAGLALQVSVNIAPLHLKQADFVEHLQAKLASRPDLPPAHLELEVLETAALNNITTLSQTLSRVRQLGVQIALDDFGTGYSSLTYLKRLPASVLKIDQSFVRDMLLDAEDLAIVDGVIGLASTFHRGVVAEGVESIEHGELLLRLGCELAQGYGIARPMPADALPGWASQWQPAAAWTDRHNRPLTRDELPAIYAEVSLRQWLRWLENRQSGIIEAPPPLDEQPCRFDSWLRSVSQQRFGHLAEFITIGATRDRVHSLADTLLRQRAEAAPHDPAQQAELDQLCALLLARLRALSAVMWRAPEAT